MFSNRDLRDSPAFVPLLHQVAARVKPLREFTERPSNPLFSGVKRTLFGSPQQTDRLNRINEKVLFNKPLTTEESLASNESLLGTAMGMSSPTGDLEDYIRYPRITKGKSKRQLGKMFSEDIVNRNRILNRMSPEEVIEQSVTNFGGRGTMTPLQARKYAEESRRLLNETLARNN